jgi:hypothetical protein
MMPADLAVRINSISTTSHVGAPLFEVPGVVAPPLG